MYEETDLDKWYKDIFVEAIFRSISIIRGTEIVKNVGLIYDFVTHLNELTILVLY